MTQSTAFVLSGGNFGALRALFERHAAAAPPRRLVAAQRASR